MGILFFWSKKLTTNDRNSLIPTKLLQIIYLKNFGFLNLRYYILGLPLLVDFSVKFYLSWILGFIFKLSFLIHYLCFFGILYENNCSYQEVWLIHAYQDPTNRLFYLLIICFTFTKNHIFDQYINLLAKN